MDSNKYILITISIMVIALLVGAVFTPIISSSTTRTVTTEIENENPDFIRFGYATTDPYEFDVSIDGETTTVGGQTGGTHDMIVLATENVAVAIVDDSLIVSDGETITDLGTSASVSRVSLTLTINGENYTPGAWSYYPKANGTYAHFSHADLNTDNKPWVAWGNFARVFTYNDSDTPDVGLVMDATVTDGVIEGVNWAMPSEVVDDLTPIEDIHLTPLDPSIITPIDLDPEPDASIQSADPPNSTRVGDLYYTFSGDDATVVGWSSEITDWAVPIPETVEYSGTTYTVTNIGNNAFYQCTNLALTSLPSGVTDIGTNAFYQCTNLALTSLPSGVTNIGSNAFQGCTNLALTSLPDGVRYISSSAFNSCTNLALTSLPSGVTNIGNNAFYQCTNLALTSLPSGVSTIGNNAFQDCIGIESIIINGNPSLGNDVFRGCDLGIIITGSPTLNTISFRYLSDTQEVLNLGTTTITPGANGLSSSAEVRTDIDALGYVAPLSVYESEQITIESPTADVLMMLPLLAGVGVLMIGVGVYISRRY